MDNTKDIGGSNQLATEIKKGKNYLLAIGINDYAHHRTLNNAVEDAKAFVEVMTARYGFELLDMPLYNKEATQRNIRKTIGKCESLTENDRIIIFYSGHGWYKSTAKIGYLVPTEAEEDPNSDFIPIDFVFGIFKSVKAHHILLIVDCCFGGSFGLERSVNLSNEKLITDLDAKKSRMVLSSGGIEPVSDGLVFEKNSPFTKALIEILKENQARQMIISDFFTLIRQKTNWNANQMPQYKRLLGLGDNAGELVLCCTDIKKEYPKITTPYDKADFEPDMIFVKGGIFKMGDNHFESEVTLSDFSIGKYPITQFQWKAIMRNNPSSFKHDNLPVENVSWYDCERFIEKLNTKTGKMYRFLTESEWEFASRGGIFSKGYIYSGSDYLDDVGWYYRNADSQTHIVGTKKPNELGIYDMSGNVWEWCGDWYMEYRNAIINNPTGADIGSYRVNRGGSWLSGDNVCHSTYRYNYLPEYSFNNVGLRIACIDY